VGFQLCVQFVEDDAGLNSGPSLGDVQLENAVEVFRGVDDDAGADRLPALRGAAAAHRDRAAARGANANNGDQILARPREDDTLGIDLVNAGVGRVEGAGNPVEPDLPGRLSLQLVAKLVQCRLSS